MSNILNCTGYELMDDNIVTASGCYVFNRSGKRYLDAESGVWCTILGHNHPVVNQAIINQTKNITHVGYRYSTGIEEETAALLLQTANMRNGRCVFLSSGSEAVELGIRIAKKITEKQVCLSLDKHYLAAYGQGYERNSEDWLVIDWSNYSEEEGPDSFLRRIPMHPLDEYFNNWDKKDQIMPAAIQSARNMDFKENKMYMLPVGTLVSLMWVRPDWFAEKNLEIPEDWDQMFDAIEKLTDKSQGHYGLSIRGGGGSAMNLEYLMYSYSGISEYFTEDGKCTINDPLHVEFVEKYLGQYNVNTPEDDLNKGWTELAATFQSGKAAVIGHNLGSASSHAKTFDNDYSKFQAVNFPKSKQGYRVQPQLVIHSYGIFENSKNKDAAWKFITFLATKEQNSELTKLYGEVPANKEASGDSWVQELPYMKTGTELINSSDTKYYKQPVYMPGYVNTLSSDIEPMVQMVMAKEMTAQEMCDEWARLMEQVKIDFDASN